MDVQQTTRTDLISRRKALLLLGAVAAIPRASAAERGALQPVSLDHVNIRVTNVAKTGQFYMGLFDTPVLRNEALRARPDLPPSEGFFLKFGDGYLAMSQAFAPDTPGLDHYSVGLRDYEAAKMAAALRESGFAPDPRNVDIWVGDPDGSFIQLRPPGGWARQTAKPFQGPDRVGPSLTPLAMSRIALRSTDLARTTDYYGRLFGTEIAPAATGGSRSFSLGDAVLQLVSVPPTSVSSTRPGMDHLRIAIKDFNVETVTSVLRERGIEAAAAAGVVRIVDPDGIRIELAAAS
jgi:catechol 2,3-dioxygenase-like lactoylglutathione lyase family enzyme